MNGSRVFRICAEAAVTAVGIGLVLFNAFANQAWVQSHFLPHFAISPAGHMAREIVVRAAFVVVGLTLIIYARRVRRLTTRASLKDFVISVAGISLAVVLALATGEFFMRTVFRNPFDELCCAREPLRQYDAVLGWAPAPNRTGRATVAGRTIEYTFDTDGARVDSAAPPIDPKQPTILFAGKSFMLGYKVPWNESIPGQVAALSGVQTANFAVDGYSNTQAYLRLAEKMPRFRRPVAVVFLFLPPVFYKDLDRRRPHLDPELHWLPPENPLRLQIMAHWLAPYDSSEKVERGVMTSRSILRAVSDLATARGAIPITVVPQFLPEDPGERTVRQRVLDAAGLPYISVKLEPDWHVPGDGHPDVRGDRAIAEAIVRELAKHEETVQLLSAPRLP